MFYRGGVAFKMISWFSTLSVSVSCKEYKNRIAVNKLVKLKLISPSLVVFFFNMNVYMCFEKYLIYDREFVWSTKIPNLQNTTVALTSIWTYTCIKQKGLINALCSVWNVDFYIITQIRKFKSHEWHQRCCKQP